MAREAQGQDPDAVRRMFGRIAPAYDKANTVLSLGIHAAWRRRTVRLAKARRGDAVADLATGTGDLALEFARRVSAKGRVVGVDFTEEMLRLARPKRRRKESDFVEFVAGDATRLPLHDAAFDVASIAFGIRNVADPSACLREMARIVRPGGRVAILEFGQPRGVMKGPFAFYSKFVIPRVGGWISGDRDAFEYLPRTSAAFPSGEAFLDLMRATGRFARVRAVPLTGGIAWIYVGEVARSDATS